MGSRSVYLWPPGNWLIGLDALPIGVQPLSILQLPDLQPLSQEQIPLFSYHEKPLQILDHSLLIDLYLSSQLAMRFCKQSPKIQHLGYLLPRNSNLRFSLWYLHVSSYPSCRLRSCWSCFLTILILLNKPVPARAFIFEGVEYAESLLFGQIKILQQKNHINYRAQLE